MPPENFQTEEPSPEGDGPENRGMLLETDERREAETCPVFIGTGQKQADPVHRVLNRQSPVTGP